LGSVFNYRFWGELGLYLSSQQGEWRGFDVAFFSLFFQVLFVWHCCKEIAARVPLPGVERAFALLMPRLSGFFFFANFAFKEDSRLSRDYEASGYEGGGLSQSLCLMK